MFCEETVEIVQGLGSHNGSNARETLFLFQRLPIALQKGAACMLGLFPIHADPVSDYLVDHFNLILFLYNKNPISLKKSESIGSKAQKKTNKIAIIPYQSFLISVEAPFYENALINFFFKFH